MSENILLAFALTTLAGLSTGIGSALALFAKRTNAKFLATSLGFSAGVMIYVSMIELFAEGQDLLQTVHGETNGAIITVVAFFGGIFLIALIDRLIPQNENPHEFKHLEEETEGEAMVANANALPVGESHLASTEQPPADVTGQPCTSPSEQAHASAAERPSRHTRSKLMRTGLMTALALAIHNFPEGLATFVSALQEPAVAIPIVIAIAIHNIPEGIAVSVPIYYATGNRKKAFLYSFASGLAEPLGAIVGFLVLMPFLNDTMYGIVYAVIAGTMVFISLDELLPSAREYGEHHLSIYGLIAGMAVMAMSLLLFM